LDEIAASGALFDSGRKLSTLCEKLSTRSLALPYSEFTLKIPSNANDVSFNTHPTGETLSDLALPFTAGELSGYVSNRITGLAKLSCKWITQAAKMFWQATLGIISQHTIEQLRTETLQRYHSWWSHSKTLSFAKSFLSYLTKTKLDTRYLAFEVFLAMPKRVRVRKAVTSRIITEADIRNVLSHIKRAEQDGKISKRRSLQCTAFIVLGAYTGQRTMATMSRLKVGQFRAALQTEKPVLLVNAEQDKIRMQHYVPLHPEVIRAIEPLLGGRGDDESMFAYDSVLTWIKREKIPLIRIPTHFTLGDLRKFAEQHGDVIQWEQSNRAYILTHGVSSVSWSNYRHPLPEHVYDIYMNYWKDVRFQLHS
jgi:integrase